MSRQSQVIRVGQARQPAESWENAQSSFGDYNRSRGLSPCTLDYYRYRILAFTRFLEGQHPGTTPADVTPLIIREFLTAETAKSKTTAQHGHCTLRAFYSFMVSDGFLGANPMDSVDKPRRDKRIIQSFDIGQVDAMLSACNAKSFTGCRDRALIAILLDTGLRASELCGLELADIDWTNKTLLVLGKGAKERLVPFGIVAGQFLSTYLARRGKLDTQAVFITNLGTPFDRYQLRRIIQTHAEAAEITGVRCSPHTLRHSFALAYVRNGGDPFSLQKCLGHSSLDMARHYCELADTDVSEKHALYSPGDRLQAGKTGTRKRIR